MISLRNVCTGAARLATGLFALAMVTPAQADFQLITTRAGLTATDSIDWGQLGPESTTPSTPFTRMSMGGINTVVSKALPGPFERQDQSSLWTGNFAPGDRLLWTNNFTSTTNNPITLDFGPSSLFGGGAQIQPDFKGDFVARLTAFDAGGNLLASFTEMGSSTANADNSAIFIGVLSTDADIARIALSLDSADAATIGDFAIDRFDLTAAAAVPEPPTLALLAFGLIGLVGCAWRVT